MSTIDDQAAEWMVRRLGRELTGPERQEFEAWYEADVRHKGAYLRAVAVDHALNRATVQQDLRPQADTVEEPKHPWRGTRVYAALGGIAASLLAALALVLAPAGSPTGEFVTARGETRQFQLADKSIASLNSASEVHLTVTETARQVRLDRGEAWFQVAKDKRKPFIVEAGDVRVRAVGTAFSVRRHDRGAEVLVTEGVVEVWNVQAGGRRVLLAHGEQAFIPDGAEAIRTMRQPEEVDRKLAWRKGRIVFTNQTLGEAVADFNRYSPRKIVIVDPAITGMTFIGQYAVDAPEVFAKDVSTYLDVPLVITGDTIQIGERKANKKLQR
jgi:transmembrane sensor